jgi:hypothetical protein
VKGLGLGTNDVLEVCQLVKLACAELYHYFAELFNADRHSSNFWLRIAMEEENQSKIFSLVVKLHRKSIIGSIQVELIEAEVVLLYMRAVLRRVKEHQPSLEEALLLALELEKKLEPFMTENVLKFADQSHEKSFLAISDIGIRRSESLKEAYSKALADRQATI